MAVAKVPAVATPPTHTALYDTLSTTTVIAAYVIFSGIAFWPSLPWDSNGLYGSGPDPVQTLWFLSWEAHALFHGLNPFFSKAMLLPTGVNLAQSTSTPLLGFLASPLTLLAGPVVTGNLLMSLAFPASATAAFAVLRKWGVWKPAAALGGMMYGFSPYMAGQGMGHLMLVFIPLPPLMAFVVSSMVGKRGPPIRLGVVLGLLAAAQFLISPEILAYTTLLILLALAWLCIIHWREAIPTARSLVAPVAATAGVGLSIIAYPLWMMLAGPQHDVGALWPVINPYHNDLLSFVVPGPFQRIPFGMRGLGARLVSQSVVAEQGGYVGIPVLLVAGVFAWKSRRSPRMQLAIVLALMSGLLSLGPWLAVDLHSTSVPLPWLLLAKVPLLQDALPVRISFATAGFVGATIAFGLDDLSRSAALRSPGLEATLLRLGARARWRGEHVLEWLRHNSRLANVALVAVLLAVVVTQVPEWPYGSEQGPLLPTAVSRVLPADDPVVLTYPYADAYFDEALGWQAGDKFAFRLLGGYGPHPGPDGHHTAWPNVISPPGLQRFLAGETPPSPYGPVPRLSQQLVDITRQTLARYQVQAIIVDLSIPDAPNVVQLFRSTLGAPTRLPHGFDVWTSSTGSL